MRVGKAWGQGRRRATGLVAPGDSERLVVPVLPRPRHIDVGVDPCLRKAACADERRGRRVRLRRWELTDCETGAQRIHMAQRRRRGQL